jgi:signal transduction histidine kinase/ActR/RegA family two-component response regulator
MIWPGIRSQLLSVAVAPAILVAALLTIVFVHGRVADLTTAHKQRALALANQLAANAEFELFAGNRSGLQLLAQSALRETDIVAVTIFDRTGQVAARAGTASMEPPVRGGLGIVPREFEQGSRYLVLRPVAASEQPGDPFFDTQPESAGRAALVLGAVALEVSRESLQVSERTLVLTGLLVTGVGLLFGTLLAVRLSRGVSRPLMELSETVERVGRGELEARVEVERNSPLRGLEEGVNRMASRLEQARDGLERRVAEATAELSRKKEEAEQANAAKSRFLAAASHDLRQPMHALGLFVDNLRGEVGGSSERVRRLLDGMSGATEAMTTMFNALLDISRLDAGVIAITPKDFPVSLLLRRIESMFTPLALQRGLRFSVVDSRAWIRSDPALLERILQNLVSNALTHTLVGGVVVGCRRVGGAVSMQVWDNGPGIPVEHQQKIFQEFVQLANPERDRTKGLGLGLAIVDRIARLLGHTVRLRSTPGKGAMFAVDVARGERGAMEHTQGAQLPLIAEQFPGLCVAIIDDDKASVDAMAGLLEQWRCRVIGAESDAKLIEQLQALGVVPDLLISDYRLRGGRTGIEAIEHVRAVLRAAVPAVLITGDTAPDRLIEAHAGRLELLHKPVASEQLKHLLRLLPQGSNGISAREASPPGSGAGESECAR